MFQTPTLTSHRLMHLSTSSPNFHLFLKDTDTAEAVFPSQKIIFFAKKAFYLTPQIKLLGQTLLIFSCFHNQSDTRS